MRGTVCIGRPLSVDVDKYGRWGVTPCGWVTAKEWEQIQHFQSPMPPLPPRFPGQAPDAMRDTKRWNGTPWAAEVESRIRVNPEKSFTLWVDFGPNNGADYAILGQETLTQVGWLTRNIFRPLLGAICAVVNLFKD